MSTLRFAEARASVLDEVCAVPEVETVALDESDGRVLAEDLRADRDYPPVDRSLRDGFAVRSADEPRGLRVVGEVRAGQSFTGMVAPGQTVEIMTGAPVPCGADAILMVEHVRRNGDRISTDRAPMAGEFVNPRASEARRGDVVVPAGRRMGYAEIAMAATVGHSTLAVYRRPHVAIIATGDEVVSVDETPGDVQIRNSNSHSIAAQVRRAGGRPEIFPVAPDDYDRAKTLIDCGLAADLLLLAGGVSAGKYDLVERVLAGLGARFFFDRVRIQPGGPLVFGKARGCYFFGLPGNPASTMVTFEVFARAALDRLSGVPDPPLPITLARLKQPFRHKPGLTRFLPAWLDREGGIVPLAWRGSSDVAAMARANAFLVAAEDRESWDAGETIGVLLK